MKPQQETRTRSYIEDEYRLWEAIASLDNSTAIKNFLNEILTASERLMLKRRWHIARLLNGGLDIRSAAKAAKVSTQTVGRIRQILQKNGSFLAKLLNQVNEPSSRQDLQPQSQPQSQPRPQSKPKPQPRLKPEDQDLLKSKYTFG